MLIQPTQVPPVNERARREHERRNAEQKLTKLKLVLSQELKAAERKSA